jgi:lysozyme family protein
MLAQAMEWLARRPDDLSQKERAYIEASVSLGQQVEAEKEAARRRQLTTKYSRAAAAIGGTLALIAIMFGIYASHQKGIAELALQTAEQERGIAELARQTAEQEKGIAELARQTAEQEKRVAEGQRQLAERLSAENARLLGMVQLFVTASIPPDREARLEQVIETLLRGKERYQNVGDKLNIPWYFIGIIHGIETSFAFNRHIHNGDPLTARTVRAPRGRPPVGDPPFSWEDSTMDFLTLQGINASTDWSLSKTLLRFEATNGLGYRNRGTNSPFLWSCTNHYSKGLFVSERIFNPNAVATYCGAAAILKRLVERGLVKLD